MEVSRVRSAVLRDRNFSSTESSGSMGPLWSPARTIERSQEGTRGGLEGFIDVPVVVQRKGVGVDGTEGDAFWGILTELPGSQTGLTRGAWGGISSHTLSATGKMGRGREWGGRASHTVVPWTWEPGGKGNCSFFEKVAEQKQNETEDSPPGPPPGEGAALFSPSPEKEQTPTSPGCPRQGRFLDFLDDLGPGWDTGGAALLREARCAGLYVDSLVEQSQSPCAAPASTPGRYYPRAPVWAPWLGEPAG